jgi:uncharacterized protein YdeI (YjbR/CyaY-like superfamily)
VETAKKDGSWNFLDDIEDLIIPEDLKSELDKNEEAEKNYQTYPESLKKQILYWIATAKREETRLRRIHKIVESAFRNENPFE